MRKKILLFQFLCLSLLAVAQPSNDDCGGIIDLGQAPFDNYTAVYNNVGATPSDIGNNNTPSCSPTVPQRDVWFTFIASDTITEYNIRVLSTPDPSRGIPGIYNPELTIYRGPECGKDNLFEFACASSATQGNPTRVSIDTIALNPGSRYYVRINDWSSTDIQPGGFKLYVTGLLAPPTIADSERSDECFGTIYDSGGPDRNYKNDEDFTYTICPVEEPKCIEFNLEYYRLEPDNDELQLRDQILFYDGEDTQSPLVAQIGKPDMTITEDGVVNGGGVNYTVKASSGCLTIRFRSNEELGFEGFKGTWRCLPDDCTTEPPLQVKAEISTDDLIENIARPGMSVAIDTIKCDKRSYGIFNAVSRELGLENGVILSTGQAINAIGPNDGISNEESIIGTPGDPDLDLAAAVDTFIIEGDTIFFSDETFDACALELEVFTPTDEISFDFTMGSEEYPEFAGGGFNDTYAFYISGPGIEGDPGLNGKENIALLPNSETVISINSVNMNANWEYYRSNEFLANGSMASNSSLEYDGFAVDKFSRKGYLTASKKVIPCEKYKLKFVIADKGDDWYDSGVFISRIGAGAPELSIDFSTGLDKFIENCTPEVEYIELRIPGYYSDTTSYNLNVSGTAEKDIDYTADIPDQVTFLPGETLKKFPIQILADNITEGEETIVITLSKEYDCGTFDFSPLSIVIEDAVAVEINTPQDTIVYCENESVSLEASGGLSYRWLPAEAFEDNLANPLTFNPTGDQWIYVQGRTGICVATDSVYIKKKSFNLEIDGTPIVCLGSTIELSGNSTSEATYEWKNEQGEIISEARILNITPSETSSYILTATPANGCSPVTKEITTGIFDDFDIDNIDIVDENDISIDPDKLLITGRIILTVSTSTSLQNASYEWYVNETLQSKTMTPQSEVIDIAAFRGNNEIIFRVDVTDENGCIKSLERSVTIENNIKILVPNVFSPDGDNVNDRFRLVNKGTTGVDILKFKVFNRWGNLVYDNENGADGWDGTYKGERAPADTYIYNISYRSQATTEVTDLVGEITLLR